MSVSCYCATCGALVTARHVIVTVHKRELRPYPHKNGGWRRDDKGQITIPPPPCDGHKREGKPA